MTSNRQAACFGYNRIQLRYRLLGKSCEKVCEMLEKRKHSQGVLRQGLKDSGGKMEEYKLLKEERKEAAQNQCQSLGSVRSPA